MITLFKLIATPFLIGGITLIGRKWGSEVSGMLIGLPLISGPVSVFLAMEYGASFAARSASGNLAGLVSVCFFCLAYSLTARVTRWPGSLAAALAAFLASTFVLNQFNFTLLSGALVSVVAISLTWFLIPRGRNAAEAFIPPRWDLPARILTATTFVVVLTGVADQIGPHLSGLITPLPVYTMVFASFTQYQQGQDAAAHLLRGVITGSPATMVFLLIAGSLLTHLPMFWTYLLAALGAVSFSACMFYLPRLAATIKSRRLGD